MLPTKLDIEKYVQRKENRIGHKYRMGIEVSYDEINQCKQPGISTYFGITRQQYEKIMNTSASFIPRPKKRQSSTHILKRRIRLFLRRGIEPKNFTVEDVILKFGEHPRCPLTGKMIDYGKPKTFAFDHIVPVARGGAATLENLQLLSPAANSAKWKWMDHEFIEICRKMGNNCPNANIIFHEVFTHQS